jgi:hypothetical protein
MMNSHDESLKDFLTEVVRALGADGATHRLSATGTRAEKTSARIGYNPASLIGGWKASPVSQGK